MSLHQNLARKELLVSIGEWALATERWWLVLAVTVAIQLERLHHE